MSLALPGLHGAETALARLEDLLGSVGHRGAVEHLHLPTPLALRDTLATFGAARNKKCIDYLKCSPASVLLVVVSGIALAGVGVLTHAVGEDGIDVKSVVTPQMLAQWLAPIAATKYVFLDVAPAMPRRCRLPTAADRTECLDHQALANAAHLSPTLRREEHDQRRAAAATGLSAPDVLAAQAMLAGKHAQAPQHSVT